MIDVNHIAKLARLGLTAEEKEKFAKDLAAILDFVKKLEEVDITGVEPTAQATGLQNIVRADESGEKEEEQRGAILANVPQRENSYIKVKAVFE